VSALFSDSRNHLLFLALACAVVDLCFSPLAGTAGAFRFAFFLQVIFGLGLYWLLFTALYYLLFLLNPRLPLACVLGYLGLTGGHGLDGAGAFVHGTPFGVVLRLAGWGLLLWMALTSRHLEGFLCWKFPRRTLDLLFLLMAVYVFFHLGAAPDMNAAMALLIHLTFLGAGMILVLFAGRLYLSPFLHGAVRVLLVLGFILGLSAHVHLEPPPMEFRGQNFLFITVEGLRHDAVKPGVMPGLAAFSREGAFYSSAYGTSALAEANLKALFVRTVDGRRVFLGSLFPERFVRAAWLPPSRRDALRSLAADFRKVRFEGSRTFPARLFLAWTPVHLFIHPAAVREGVGLAAEGREWLGGLSRPFICWMHVASSDRIFSQETLLKAGAGVLDPSEDYRRAYERYLGRLDRSLSDLLQWLRRTPYSGKTNIFILGVGGMELFEHGRLGPATGYYEESVRFPLLWLGPSVPPGMRLDARVSLLDLFPTLAKMYNLSDNVKKFEGLDISSSFRNIFPADRLFLLTGTREAASGRAAVYEGHKIILRPDGRVELYDLDADPGEKDDRACAEPEMTGKLKSMLSESESSTR
jgi:hypothetical protein